MYLIILTIHGANYYLGHGGWQGLKDNAYHLTELEARTIDNRLKAQNPFHEYTTIPTLKQDN